MAELNAEWKLATIQSADGHPILVLQTRVGIPDLRVDDVVNLDIALLYFAARYQEQVLFLNSEVDAKRASLEGFRHGP